MNFLFRFKTMEMRGGGWYKFAPEKMLHGMKTDLSLGLLDSRIYISNRDDSLSSGKENFCDVISLKVEKQIS